MLSSLARLSRTAKTLILVWHDAVMATAAIWLTVLFRAGSIDVVGYPRMFTLTAIVVVLVPGVAGLLGYYRMVLRFNNPVLIMKTAQVVTISGVSMCLLAMFGGAPAMRAIGLGVVFGLTLFSLLTLSRTLARWSMGGYSFREAPRIPVAVYGAGVAGRQLVGLLRYSSQYATAVLLDDDPALQGRLIEGLPVVDPRSPRLRRMVASLGIKQVLLAMPRLERSRRREILALLEKFPVRVRTVPDVHHLLAGQAKLGELREVSVEDVLGRDPVPPLAGLLERCILGKSVLVTGGGGSIGAELCRQALELRPARLIVLDHSEYALYAIEQELLAAASQMGGTTELVFLLGSITSRTWMQSVFSRYAVDTVYHAAAYKHVPLVESNPDEGLRNNVVGTWITAELAATSGCGHFVLISSDKAVRPTSIMGATKRMAELVVQSYAERFPSCIFSMVRFGNVLGSSGSIVPLFRSQIEKGGPLTLTHPDVTRYFMTIPEAVQLVIQAGAMAAGGEVFILDMGEPVKIGDLARKMIGLAGLTVRSEANPEGDIEIKVVGLRAGEKLFEELLLTDNAAGTAHPRIWCAREATARWAELEPQLQGLESRAQLPDEEVRRILSRWVDGFGDAKAT